MLVDKIKGMPYEPILNFVEQTRSETNLGKSEIVQAIDPQNEFDLWNLQKQEVSNSQKKIFFREREIWWCRIGKNIGYEQNGKGAFFERPVLVLRKLGNKTFIGIPITTKTKLGNIFVSFDIFPGKKRVAIIGQIRLLDASRLNEKITTLDKLQFEAIRKATKELL